MNSDITVVIPLYNKEKEIEKTVRSVLSQTLAPAEIIVVDDGSTDNGPQIVRDLDCSLIRLVSQPNSGVSVARNRGVDQARTPYVAFLDGDDWWDERFLEKQSEMISRYPGCGIYSAAFRVVRHDKSYPAKTRVKEGVVEDFFREAMTSYICIPSAVVIPVKDFQQAGGFPAGMKIGEDLYFWIRLASAKPVCFTPEPLVNYQATASNRSAGSYTAENTAYSFEDLYRNDGNFYRNEYIAKCAIGKALTLSAKGDTEFGRRTEKFFSYTELYRRGLWKLRILNRIPRFLRPAIHNGYNRLAWLLARKGL